MEHIEALFTLARDNFLLIFIIGTCASFLESFKIDLTFIPFSNAGFTWFIPAILSLVLGEIINRLINFKK